MKDRTHDTSLVNAPSHPAPTVQATAHTDESTGDRYGTLTRRGFMRTGALAGLFGVAATAGGIAAYAPEAQAADHRDKAKRRTRAPEHLERVKATLVAPPHVMAHEQATSAAPKIVEFTLTIEEKKIVVDKKTGATMQAMTFNGSMPGPTLVVHEDDYVELTLINPATNKMDHNVDFHGSTGAMGGGDLTIVKPGQQVTLRFKADRTGVFIYHCAPPDMVAWHVVSGMSGVLMVLPRTGLVDEQGRALHYDKVYTIGEFDLYIPKDENGKFKDYKTALESYGDTMKVMRGLIPSHIVLNGQVGALTGENALTAKVGETVLIIHSSANYDARPHLIGGHGDYVWQTGKFINPPERNLETWFVRGGSAAAALYTFRQPGTYAYLDHNLIHAFLLGAAGHFKVEGKWNNDLMTQVSKPGPIPGTGSATQ